MTKSDADPQPIDYATPAADENIPFIPQMLWWRSKCGFFIWMMVVAGIMAAIRTPGSLIIFAVSVISFVAASACAITAIIYMGRAALMEVGPGYAVRHILLAVALSLFLFLGVWVVPGLVQSDLVKWRVVDDPSEPGTK